MKWRFFASWTGCYLYEVDGKRFHADVGDLVSVPGGAEHGFVNITTRPARQLVMILPGLDAGDFFTELGGVVKDDIPDQQALNDFGHRWNVEFLVTH